MGTKIKGKYAGQCKICGSDWKVGEDIFYQKDPKAICSDKECFEEQGGKFTPYSTQGTLTSSTTGGWGQEDVNGDRFGQIRSKMMDQFMGLTNLIKE